VAALTAARASACEAALAAAPPSGVEKGVRERAREREIQESKRERESWVSFSANEREKEKLLFGGKKIELGYICNNYFLFNNFPNYKNLTPLPSISKIP